MAKQRIQADTSALDPAPLRPVATPVDTFERSSAGAGLSQLAAGLSSIAPSLARFTDAYTAHTTATQQEAGVTAARKLAEEGKNYNEAVKSGAIPRGANPYFIAGFREQWGRVTADEWKKQLIADAANDPHLQESTNVADFDKFAQDHLKNFLDNKVGADNRDNFFERGFGFRADAYLSQLQEENARRVADRVEKYSDDTHFAEIKTHVMDSLSHGVDLAQIAKDIDQANADAIAHGRDGGAVNRTTVKAILGSALEMAARGDHRALDVLDLINKVQGGKGSTLGGTTYGTEALLKAEDIKNTLYTADQRERQATDQQRQDKIRGVLSNAVSALVSNPHADLTSFVLQAGNDAGAVEALSGLQRNITNLKFVTDESVKSHLFSQIWTEPGSVDERTIVQWLSAGKLETQDAAWLMGQIQSRKEADRSAMAAGADHSNKVFEDFQFRQTLGDIGARVSNTTLDKVFGTAADKVAYAKATLMQRWVSYMEGAGAAATPQQRSEWLDHTANTIVTYMGTGQSKIKEAPKAPLTGKDWSKEAVLSKSDMARIYVEVKQQRLSPGTIAMFQLWNLQTPAQQSAFIRAQLGLTHTAMGDVNTATDRANRTTNNNQ